ncbi:hypothetical protein RhiirA1_461202 [Rhizophagus irregularis]|uniref:Uncharacterized protein n=2 Tax=Rhizophagus irregularis TaxID=588596 RepID=A0A2N0RPU9_9GLOM|nr:hypothetical protein RhiirA1_461202 [Rhizophagus irregularis]
MPYFRRYLFTEVHFTETHFAEATSPKGNGIRRNGRFGEMNRNHFRDLPELIRPEMQKYGSEKTVPSKLARMSYVFNIAYFFVTDNGTQTDNITCNHEEEINKRVKSELNVIQQQLFKFNRDTFGRFMQGSMKIGLKLISNCAMRLKI